MKILLVAFSLLLLSGAQLKKSPSTVFGGIQLPDGYSLKQERAIDASVWKIMGQNGFEISFEAGPSEGSWANTGDHGMYSWYREDKFHGYTVRFAFVKSGLKTRWEPDRSRGLPPGDILLVTFLLNGSKSDHTANFSAKIANSGELADALLIIATFDPSKGSF